MEQYFTVGLQDPLQFTYLVYALAGAALLVSLVLFILSRVLKDPVPGRARVPAGMEVATITDLQGYYIGQLEELRLKTRAGALTPREAYARLSFLFRSFVFDIRGTELQTRTLREIRAMGDRVLTSMMEEYYEPEFAALSTADILASIRKTKEVIKRWT